MRAAARFRKQALNVMYGGSEGVRPRQLKGTDLLPNRAALRHRPAGLSVGTGLTGAMAAPALRGSLASSNKFDQYGNPNTGTEHPSYQAVRERVPARRRWRAQALRGSGGATPCQGAASRRRAGRPGGRQKREARHCLFHYLPQRGV